MSIIFFSKMSKINWSDIKKMCGECARREFCKKDTPLKCFMEMRWEEECVKNLMNS